MKYGFGIALLFIISSSISPLSAFNNDRITTNLKKSSERIRQHGYPAEEHYVQTEDGYVLQIFRIPGSPKFQNENNTPKPAVLIQHGLLSCSDIWLATGPDNSLPFLLADLGYDVWLGNARGNSYSRSHLNLSTKNPRFWRFSWHEIGVYDISAMIDYILAETKQEALHYVGHSQGTTVFFVLMSMLPPYNDKIKTAHMLAPIGYMNHMTDKLVNNLAPYLGKKGILSNLFGSAEFLPRNKLFMLLGYNMCGSESILFPQLCSSMAMLFDGEQMNVNRTSMTTIAQTHPAGASTDQILHYMQEFNSGHFRQFDFGEKRNKKEYNQPTPPDYQIEEISSEVYFYYSDNDSMAAVEDVERFGERLPNLKAMHHISDPTWAHIDFALALEVKNVVHDVVIREMSDYETRNKPKQ